MPQVDFYLLGRTPVERVLPMLAARTLDAGQRLLIVAGDEALLDRLDGALWTHDPASFLPHARSGGEGDAHQPVLLCADLDAVNGARFVALADGRWREEALGFERVFYLFAPDRLNEARDAWRALDARDDVENRFWKQDDAGKWRPGP